MALKSATVKPIRLDLLRVLKAKKWSLADLHRKTGIDYASLHDHAHGKTKRVDLLTLARLKRALRVPWDVLLKTS